MTKIVDIVISEPRKDRYQVVVNIPRVVPEGLEFPWKYNAISFSQKMKNMIEGIGRALDPTNKENLIVRVINNTKSDKQHEKNY